MGALAGGKPHSEGMSHHKPRPWLQALFAAGGRINRRREPSFASARLGSDFCFWGRTLKREIRWRKILRN